MRWCEGNSPHQVTRIIAHQRWAKPQKITKRQKNAFVLFESHHRKWRIGITRGLVTWLSCDQTHARWHMTGFATYTIRFLNSYSRYIAGIYAKCWEKMRCLSSWRRLSNQLQKWSEGLTHHRKPIKQMHGGISLHRAKFALLFSLRIVH